MHRFICRRPSRPRLATGVVALCLTAALSHAQTIEPTRLLRFPDVYGDQVVFTYAGDLWLASTHGGTARRLTSAPGLELMARFSPDGRSIAFTGQYGGDEQVYVIPTAGGIPRQLTFYPAAGPLPPRWGYDNLVYGWTPDGQSVLFRSLRDTHTLEDGQLFTVPVAGGLPVPLPMPTAGAGDFSPDGKTIAYSPMWRDFRTWKRYQGGWATDLFLFDLEHRKAQRITDSPRTDRDPMWIGDGVCFASDRDGHLNLYRYDLASRETRQLTSQRESDVRWPSADRAGQIVYELSGGLHLYDTRSDEDRALDIYVPDDGVARRPAQIAAIDQLESFELSPAGERALIVARGDVMTLPLEHGVTRNLTRSSGSHDREASWSADGQRVVYVSDSSGEEEVWLEDQNGIGASRQITRGGATRYFAPRLSPDGKRIAVADQNGHLWVVDVQSGERREIADDPFEPGLDHRWSPDGRYLAYSVSDANGLRGVWIWRAADGQTVRATPALFEAHGPAWAPDGACLYFLSFREYPPQLGTREFNYVANRNFGVYALALRPDVENPWGPRNDEVGAQAREEENKKKEPGEDKGEASKTPPEVRIDFTDLPARVIRVPIDPDNISRLEVTSDAVVYERDGAFYYGRDSETQPQVVSFDVADRQPKTLADGVQAWSLSGDGKRLLWRDTEGAFKFIDVTDADGDGDPDSKKIKDVSTAGLVVDRRPTEEWAEIFREVWRRYRDYFYVANMHGYDWQAIRARYEPLLAFVGDRTDLNYVLGEMIAELNVSHAYIEGGDLRLPSRPTVALAGARFELDAASRRYRIARIFPGENEEPDYRSPLTEVGVGVKAGDYLLAVNGHELRAGDNPWQWMQAPAGQVVEWRVSSRADGRDARNVVFDPIASEDNLLYLAWVTANRERVERLSQGRLGYIHLPDMGAAGIREFIKWWYPQLDKDALLIDDRANGGGNVSQMIIERLNRRLLGTDFARNYDLPLSYPQAVVAGPKAVLINGTSASDGDIFPYMFRAAGLGKLIGKRTWGGVIGISDRGPLIDGGAVYVPEFGTAGPDGRWIIEGQGVEPDIEVDQNPEAVIEGGDPQLERGVGYLLEQLKTTAHGLPSRAPAPVKTP
jgi:tricorn protease